MSPVPPPVGNTPAARLLRPRLAATTPCMQRVDRLGWKAGAVLDAYGVRLGVRSDSATLLRRALDQWERRGARVATTTRPGESADVVVSGVFSLHSGAADAIAGARPPLALFFNSTRLLLTDDRDELLERAEAALRVAVADAATTHLFVHAGVVAYRGEAVLVPGACLAGKTTLVRALLDRGAAYYSDDVALVDDEGLVHAYAGPLAVRATSGAPQIPVPAESLGAAVGGPPLRAGVVALASYRAGARWRPRAVTGGAATLALLAHAGGVQTRPARALGTLGRLLRGATVLRGARGEADVCARDLLRAIDARVARRDGATRRPSAEAV